MHIEKTPSNRGHTHTYLYLLSKRGLREMPVQMGQPPIYTNQGL